MTTGFAAKQKQLQNFLFSLPSFAFHLKSHKKSWKRAGGTLKRTIDSEKGEKFSKCTDKNKSEA